MSYSKALVRLNEWSPKGTLPEWLHKVQLPPLRGKDSEILPKDLVTKVLHALRARNAHTPDVRLKGLREWVDRDSASAFAVELFGFWRLHRTHMSNRWIVPALSLLGDDAVAKQVATWIVEYAGSYSVVDQRLVPLLGPVLNHVAGGTAQIRALHGSELPPGAVAVISRCHAALAPVQDAKWNEDLFALSKPKSLPGFMKPGLPDLTDADGQPLDPSWHLALVRACVAGGADLRRMAPQIRHHLAPQSLHAWVTHCVECWSAKGSHGRYAWVLEAVAAFGGDDAVLALEPLVVDWPNQSDTGRKRAVAAMPIFRRNGSDTALLCLLGLRQKAKKPSVIWAGEDEVARAAADRGMAFEELVDWITPTCGLDETGGRIFDYGPRQFHLQLTDHLEPRFRDADGGVHEVLPPEADTDDTEKVHAARHSWEIMDAKLGQILSVQTHRLEQDMVNGRRWSAKAWRGRFLEHPLMLVYTRRLLWGVYDEKDGWVCGFRTAEDLTLVDIEDDELSLSERRKVGVAHPADLPADELAAWNEHFADYELIAPFQQLRRGDLPALDLEKNGYHGLATVGFRSGVLRDVLLLAGWDRDEAGWLRRWYQRDFPSHSVRALARMDPGVHAGDATYDHDDQTISAVEFYKVSKNGRRAGKPMALSEVPTLCIAEALYQLDHART